MYHLRPENSRINLTCSDGNRLERRFRTALLDLNENRKTYDNSIEISKKTLKICILKNLVQLYKEIYNITLLLRKPQEKIGIGRKKENLWRF